MNKIYRLVWNKSLSLWTVVSENARGVTKKRNVSTIQSVTTHASSSVQQNNKLLGLKPSLIALTISSVFWGSSAFAATNTGGGAVSNNGSGNSMAISPTQSQCGSDGQASVNGNNGVAVGCGNSVGPVGTNGQGLVNRRGTGSNNYPTGPANIVSSATAVGKNNKISNTGGASLFGTGNVSEGSGTFHNVGIGQGNLLGGPGYNTAIGIGNEAVTGASSVVIGTDNRSRGGTAIVMGRQSYADANYGISLGNTATVTEGSTAGIAVGHSATVSGVRGVAIGNSTASSNNQDTATAATASGTDAVAIGTTSNATANQTTAVGRRANAAGNNASAYGNQASAQGVSSVAVGDNSNAQGDNDIAVGRNAATASGGRNNIAMGNGVTTGATGQNVAIGSDGSTANSRTADGGAVSIGRGQKATGDGAVAIGDPNVSNGDGAVTLGRNNTAAGDTAGNTAADGAVAIGNENQAIGQGSVALGNRSNAAQTGSIALGDAANAQASRGVALGSNAVATNADDVALGSGSTTSTATGSSFLTGIAAPASVVSVGDRRIQNLSDGAADTDAVNVRQLKSLKDIVDEQGDTTAAGLGGGSTYDPDTGTVTNPTYNVNGNEINNVGDAITELDKGWTLQSNGANAAAVKAGDTVDIGIADGEENLKVAKEGNDIKYSLNRDLKVDSVTAGDTVINNDGMSIAGGPSVTKDGIDAGNNTIGNVADGVADSDAVNKGQLDKSSQDLTDKGFGLTAQDGTTVQKKLGEAVEVVGADSNITTKVEDGKVVIELAKDLDVNSVKAGDTLINNDGMTIAGGPSVTKDGIDAGNNTIGNVADGVADSDAVNKGQLDKSSQDLTDKGFGLTAQDGSTVQKKLGEAVDVVGADSNITTKVQDGKVAIELAKDLDVNSVKAGDTVINNDGMSIANGPSVTKSGIDAAGNTISNVGPGVAGTDAVNKDQLDNAAAAAKTEVTEGKNITVTKTTGDDGQDIYNVATADDVEFNSVKAGDTVINNDGMTIAGGPSVTKDGIDAGNNTIGNVADGVADSDAVNKGQLDKSSQDLTDKGFGLTAQDGSTVQKKLGEAVEVVGADSNITTKVEDGKVAIELAKDLDVNSIKAGDTVINNDGMSIANGPSVTKSGINAAGNTISNVGPGVAGTDAVNKDQLDNAAAAAKTEVEAGKNMTVESETGADGQTIYTVATADDVEFDSVKVGDVSIDGSTGKISGVSAGDVAADSTDAINGSQLHGVADSVKNAIGGETTLNPDGTVTTSNVGNTGQNNIHDAIDSVRGQAVAAKTEVEAGKNMTVESETGADGQTIYTVATADDVEFDSVKVGDVSIDGSTGKISGVAAGDVNPDSTDAINGSQLANNAQSVADALGGGSTVNPDGTVSKPNYTVNGDSINNVGDAITALDKGWTLQSNGANAAAVKAGDTVDIGTADGEENLEVTKEGNDIKYSLNRDLKVDSVTAGDTVINNDGLTIANGPSVTRDGINAGGKKLTNVAAGTEGTDAVNKDQLDNATAAAKTEVTEGKNITVTKTTGDDGQDIYNVATADDVEFNNVKVGDVTIDGTTGKISGVAGGDVNPNSTDAINGSQLHAQGEGVKNIIGGNTTYDPNTGRYTNPDIGGTGQDNINDAIGAVGDAAKAAKTTVKEGENIVVTESKNADGSTNYEVATAKDVKFDSVTATDEEGNETVLTATGTQVKDGEGNEAEYGAKGISLKDQDGNGTILNSGGLGFVDPMGNNIGPSITAAGINAGNTVITGVAAGRVAADSQDAINGSQLHGVADSVKNIIGGNTTVNPDGTLSGSNIGGTGKDNINDAIGAVGKAAQEAKSTVSDGKNIIVKESKNADGSTDYEVSTAPDLEVDSVTAGGTKVDGDGLHIDGGPSVTKDGIDAGDKKVTGVADGEVAKGSKDAVNGGQLHDVADSVKNVVGGNTTVNPDGTISTSNVGGTGHNNINDAIASVKQDAQAAKSTVSNKDGNIKVNETTKADGSKDYEVGLAKDITVDSVTAKDVNANQVTVAGDQGTTNITGDGISITGPKGEAGPSMSTDGINAGGKKVTGVADGAIASGSKDAINGGQLHQSYQDVGAALGGGAGYDPEKGWKGPTYNVAGSNYNNVGDALGALNQADQALDNRITNLGDQMQQAFYDTNRRIDDVEKKANAGVAAAIALEAAPFVAGKYTYAVGAAYHGGENAFGATLRKTADNGRWSLTGGVAAASQGDPSFRLGLSGVID